MSEEKFDRVQQLFLTALERPSAERAVWLREQCGSDLALLEEVRSLLRYDNPADDPLEAPLDFDFTKTSNFSKTSVDATTRHANEIVNDDEFLSRLSDVGILSSDELRAIEKDLSGEDGSSSPRTLASRLVSDGKLTQYQASAFLKGQPELLFDKYLILDLIEREGVTVFFGVPTMFQMLIDSSRFASTDFSRVRFMVSGGAPLGQDILETFKTQKSIRIWEGYGLTEAGPNNFIANGKLGTVGHPMPHVDVKIVDPDGIEVPTGEEGEIILRGSHTVSYTHLRAHET